MAMKPVSFKSARPPSGFDGKQGPGANKLKGMPDLSQLRQLIEGHQWEAGAVAILILFVFLTTRILGDRLPQVSKIDKEMVLLTKKQVPIEASKKIIEEKSAFLKSALPGITEKELVSFLTALAEKRGVTISEFQPVKSQTTQYYISSEISLLCSADTFTTILSFLKDLETSSFSFRVETLRIKGQNMDGPGLLRAARTGHAGPFVVDIKLSSLSLREL